MTARPGAVPARLTPAQVRILGKIASGIGTAETARALSIAQGTVSVQVSSMSRRLGVSGRAALTHVGYCNGQLDRPEPAEFDGTFSEAEACIVRLVSCGASLQEIAHACQLSRDAARERLRALRLRMGASHDAHLVTLGWRYGLLDESHTGKPAHPFSGTGVHR
ncbi:helix-turn-helix transcriptional regulator [Streptomyces sp. NPDC091265]|uniref:helix-turn-helix domain-containing protein n=1 Tax=unclassified Streptomyces TaxID=2593676 RepID=UPI00344DEC84